MKTLILLLLLVSCGKGGGGSSGASAPAAATGNVYRVPAAISWSSTIGISYMYSCTATQCTITGETLQYYPNNTAIVTIEIEGTLTKVTGGYYGQVDYNDAPYVGSMGLFIADDYSFKSLDDGTRCARFSTSSNSTSYDAFKNGFSAANNNVASPDLGGYELKSNCGI